MRDCIWAKFSLLQSYPTVTNVTNGWITNELINWKQNHLMLWNSNMIWRHKQESEPQVLEAQ